MGKRVLDLVASTLGLLLLVLPGLAVAVWIKLDSPGPVFFRQERVGRWGRSFRIHKFRTMREDAATVGGPLTVGQDPRVTRVGAMLRARRLDELPQLIDVWLGDMSLVGPRPELPRYVAHYPPALRERVLSVRPGITDPASLAFRNEAARLALAPDPEREYLEAILPEKLTASADYVSRASVSTDLRIIFQSLSVLWKP